MHPALKATMAAATFALVTTAATDPASARTRGCAHVGRAYSAIGTLADGSTLAQVAGTSTKRTSDDRYSGTLDVTVTQAGRERALGLHAYVVTSVRIRGAAGDAVPATGTEIKLSGLSISASAARRCHVEEPTAARATRAWGVGASATVYADTTDGTDDATAPPVVTGVQITSVAFGGKGASTTRKPSSSGDDAAGDPSSDASGDDDTADGADTAGDPGSADDDAPVLTDDGSDDADDDAGA